MLYTKDLVEVLETIEINCKYYLTINVMEYNTKLKAPAVLQLYFKSSNIYNRQR